MKSSARTAVLGPTNTGKTHLAVERMCAHSSGMIGFPLRLLAREIYDRVVAMKGQGSRRAGHWRRKDRARKTRVGGCARSKACRSPRCRFRRRGRGAIGRGSGARPCLHRPPAACARSRGDDDPGVGGAAADAARTDAGCGDRRPSALFDAELRGREKDFAPAPPLRDRRVQRRGSVRHRRDAAAAARRRGGGDGGAEPTHPQRAGRDVPVGRGRLSGRDRRDRHGAEHGRGARRLRQPAQVRRQAPPAADGRGDGTDRGPRGAAPARRYVRRAERGRGRMRSCRRKSTRSRSTAFRGSTSSTGATAIPTCRASTI